MEPITIITKTGAEVEVQHLPDRVIIKYDNVKVEGSGKGQAVSLSTNEPISKEKKLDESDYNTEDKQVTKGVEEELYNLGDLVQFGNYLLSNKRNVLTSVENKSNVTDADLKNWRK